MRAMKAPLRASTTVIVLAARLATNKVDPNTAPAVGLAKA